MSQTVDKVPAKAGLFYIYGRFSGIIKISEGWCFFMMTKNSDKKREQMLWSSIFVTLMAKKIS